VQGGVTADYCYEIHLAGDRATRVTLVAQYRSEGLMWRALSWPISRAISLTDGRQLEALKSLVEGATDQTTR
jgi:hypothetical protein